MNDGASLWGARARAVRVFTVVHPLIQPPSSGFCKLISIEIVVLTHGQSSGFGPSMLRAKNKIEEQAQPSLTEKDAASVLK